MLIINADDWGGWKSATDAAVICFRAGRITSATGMVFMADSERAARLAIEMDLPVGLHLNLNQPFTCASCPPDLTEHHRRVVRFLRISKYAQLLYHPFLRQSFRFAFQAQVAEFQRLYGRPPTHVDGHQHMHLCANMRFDRVIPKGWRVRRSFSFCSGEKSVLNRTFRRWVDRGLEARHLVTDYFFSLGHGLRNDRLDRIAELSRSAVVELMTHPEVADEVSFLMSDRFQVVFGNLPRCSFAGLGQTNC